MCVFLNTGQKKKKKSYGSKKILYPTSTVELIPEVGGEIKSTKKLLKYSIVQYNAVAMENTLCAFVMHLFIYIQQLISLVKTLLITDMFSKKGWMVVEYGMASTR